MAISWPSLPRAINVSWGIGLSSRRDDGHPPPHQGVLGAKQADGRGLLDPASWQDLLALPDTAAEVELPDLEHVGGAEPQEAAGAKQPGGVRAHPNAGIVS